jgi:chaperonin GroES
MLRPLGDRVVIELIKESPTTAGGIVLPDSAQGKSIRGKVVAVGNGKLLDNGTRVPLDVKVGDTIVFAEYGSKTVDVAGEEYTIVSERDILAVAE